MEMDINKELTMLSRPKQTLEGRRRTTTAYSAYQALISDTGLLYKGCCNSWQCGAGAGEGGGSSEK